MQDLIQSLIGWLPDVIEPYAEVLIYLAMLGAMAVAPLIVWLAWAVATTGRRSTTS
jgi:hypothetical protein